ncbi:hypothetical protein EV702DRAFT_483450 [Suillus placidus]|uniref:Uncharacterized protein n=1 Tax=Suillus placidus TaxID=48579 RepID=A0A9P6ZQ98_9AGAM|nr:hypothetical protein EV702DRAFT_370526 [Suillus placidus]KAG1774743.1 hypothetical protein EV702DRAFT_483450 [Suillus placidus]
MPWSLQFATAQRGCFGSVTSVSLALHLRERSQNFFHSAFEIIRCTYGGQDCGLRAIILTCLYMALCLSYPASRARTAIANSPLHLQYNFSHHWFNGPHNNHAHVIQILYNHVRAFLSTESRVSVALPPYRLLRPIHPFRCYVKLFSRPPPNFTSALRALPTLPRVRLLQASILLIFHYSLTPQYHIRVARVSVPMTWVLLLELSTNIVDDMREPMNLTVAIFDVSMAKSSSSTTSPAQAKARVTRIVVFQHRRISLTHIVFPWAARCLWLLTRQPRAKACAYHLSTCIIQSVWSLRAHLLQVFAYLDTRPRLFTSLTSEFRKYR